MWDTVALLCLAFLLYAYAGYPLVLRLLAEPAPDPPPARPPPRVTVLFAARDEERCIAETLDSILDSHYPASALEVLVVSDGSTDSTDEIVRSYAGRNVRLIRLEGWNGRNASLAAAQPRATGELIVVVDASSVFERAALSRITRHFSDPTVGSVVGAKTIRATGSDVSRGDGLYWRYESLLRSLESRTGSSWVGVEGGFFAIRKEALRMDFPAHLAPDYCICCHVYERGLSNRYDPGARIHEAPSSTMGVEFRRKVRVIVRGIRAFLAYRHLLHPIRNPAFAFQNLSHRLCRWLAPFFLIALLVASSRSDSAALRVLFHAQVGFYALAAVGLLLPVRSVRLLAVPTYFSVVNAAALVAWLLLPLPFVAWRPTEREGAAPR